MKLIVDLEAKKVLDDIMHQALLYNGLNNFLMVSKAIASMQIEEPKPARKKTLKKVKPEPEQKPAPKEDKKE